jgi:hypothetical protein
MQMGTGIGVAAAILLFAWMASSSVCAADAPPAPPVDDAQTNDGITVLDRAVAPMTGDLDAMRRLGRVRVLVSFSRTNFFVSQASTRASS